MYPHLVTRFNAFQRLLVILDVEQFTDVLGTKKRFFLMAALTFLIPSTAQASRTQKKWIITLPNGQYGFLEEFVDHVHERMAGWGLRTKARTASKAR